MVISYYAVWLLKYYERGSQTLERKTETFIVQEMFSDEWRKKFIGADECKEPEKTNDSRNQKELDH